jgi:hypothetical protein
MRRLAIAAVLLGGCDEERGEPATDDGIAVTVDDSESGSSDEGGASEDGPCDNAWCVDRCERTCLDDWSDESATEMECIENCPSECEDQCIPDAQAVCEDWCGGPGSCREPRTGEGEQPGTWWCRCGDNSDCLEDMTCTMMEYDRICTCDHVGC